MLIPDYQTLMLPLVRLAENEQEHKFRDAVEALAQEFALTDEEQCELLPSGSQPVFSNRVGCSAGHRWGQRWRYASGNCGLLGWASGRQPN